ncbi:hypothetical protein K1719_008900 [Acacia pycnantha]|nr:hypothetical protein K1719_008900 [Acacia pycnantha]
MNHQNPESVCPCSEQDKEGKVMENDLQEKTTGLMDEEDDDRLRLTCRVFFKEVKEVCSVAAPMVALNSSTFFLQTIALMMVGHLGKLAQSSSVAISLCAVTGFSVIFGLASALETLCGQAYGAKQYRKFGVQIQTGIFCLLLCCIPLSLFWLNLGRVLVLLGQDPLIAREAGKFAVCLIPALFGYATLQALVRYYLMQSLITTLVFCSSFTICFHVVFCWTMVFKSGLGRFGGALAIGTSYWLNAILLPLYMKFSDSCAKTRAPISMELFHGIRDFFALAIPSAIMACLQWWSYEELYGSQGESVSQDILDELLHNILDKGNLVESLWPRFKRKFEKSSRCKFADHLRRVVGRAMGKMRSMVISSIQVGIGQSEHRSQVCK